MTSSSPLTLLRNELEKCGVQGFILPRTDRFMSEYLTASEERVAFLTGFTGSNAIAIVLLKKACVFSDGRYAIQIKEEALPGWDTAISPASTPSSYLATHAKNLKVGFDPSLTNEKMKKEWEKSGVELVPLDYNPVDKIWINRPKETLKKVVPHPLDYAGETSASKRKKLSKVIQNHNADAALISDCSSLMWLVNIRGSDIKCSPIGMGYGLFHKNGKAEVFIDPKRFANIPEDPNIAFFKPESLEERLKELQGKRVLLDPSSVLALKELIENAEAEPVPCVDPSKALKACKNQVEISGHRKAQLADNYAICRFLASLEDLKGTETEFDLAQKLYNFRKKNGSFFVSNSFDTISAINANAALPHYTPPEEGSAVIEDGIYLVDSGGQYETGTTDLTRTVWLGEKNPPPRLKKIFTHVLKGMIALSMARFPNKTPGYRLDTIARAPLWQIGGDYEHGTGHGVGSFLSVHEGPQSISPRPNEAPLEEGMILSNEPGFYKEGQYGIRIENLVLVKKSTVNQGKGRFLEFETLSYVPIDRRLIDISYLNPEEIDWIDEYHYETLARHEKLLNNKEQEWLRRACQPLGENC